MLYRHEPESPLFRVDVVQTSNPGMMSGTMPAYAGMVLAHGIGTIVKANEKSMIVRDGTVEWRETGKASVTREEARKFGYPQRVPSAK